MGGTRKADKESRETNKIFERQQRRLNRKRFSQIFGIGFLIALVLALQLTPYRDLPRNIFHSVVQFMTDLFSGPDSAEPDPKYW